MAKRKPVLFLTVGTAIAFITGGAVAYWWLNRAGGPQHTVELPVGIEVIPQNALMTLSFSTDPQQWQTLRRFGTEQTQPQADQMLAQWRDRWLSENNLDFQRDIQPWVGSEMTIAVLPNSADGVATAEPTAALVTDRFPESPESPESPEFPGDNSPGIAPIAPPDGALPLDRQPTDDQTLVAILPIADPLQAQQTLETALDDLEQGQEQVYEGITIQELTNSDGQTYATAVFNNRFVAIAPESVHLRQMIDAYQANTAIDELEGYTEALQQTFTDAAFMRLYVNVPAAQALAAEGTGPVPSSGLLPFNQNQGLAATITLEDEGIRFKTVTWREPDPDAPAIANPTTAIASVLPDTTLMMVSGSNLTRMWTQYNQPDAITPDPASLLHPDNIRQGLQSVLGIDIEQDLLPWMTGEFAVGLIPISDDTAPNGTGMGALLLLQASDRDQAERSLDDLDDVMGSRHGFEVSQDTLDGNPVTIWTQPFSGLTVVRGWLEGDRAFLALRAPVADTVIPTPANTLTETALYQTITAQNPETTGQFFVDLKQLTDPQANVPIPLLPNDYADYTAAIRAIGVTTRSHTAQSTLYEVFVALEKAGNPGTLPDVSTEEMPTPDDELTDADTTEENPRP